MSFRGSGQTALYHGKGRRADVDATAPRIELVAATEAASDQARSIAKRPNRADRLRKLSRPSNSGGGSAPRSTSLPMRTGKKRLSNCRISAAPERPSRMASQISAISVPSEQTAPIPVMTTRLGFSLLSIGSLVGRCGRADHVVKLSQLVDGPEVPRGAQRHRESSDGNGLGFTAGLSPDHAVSVLAAHQLDFEVQLIAGPDELVELQGVERRRHGHRLEGGTLAQHPVGQLHQALHDERPRHDRMVRKVVREEVLTERDVLHAHRALSAFQFPDPIDEKESHPGWPPASAPTASDKAMKWSNRTSSPPGNGTDLPHAGQMNSGSDWDSFIVAPQSGQVRSMAAFESRSCLTTRMNVATTNILRTSVTFNPGFSAEGSSSGIPLASSRSPRSVMTPFFTRFSSPKWSLARCMKSARGNWIRNSRSSAKAMSR